MLDIQTNPIIKAVSLRKDYGEFHAVKGIDFEVMPGEIFGMLGPNGAGKTTTMRMLSSVSPITAGQIFVDGLNVQEEPRKVRDRIGVVAQHDGLDPDLNVLQNLVTYARYFSITGNAAEDRAREMLEFFGMDHRADSSIHTLSGGMKRRLTLARAFMTRPRVVILDEPSTGLDPQARNRVWEQLFRIRDAGATILMSTHYMEEAAQLCDRLVIMDNGKILARGTPDDLVMEHAGSLTAVIRPNNDSGPAVRSKLESMGKDVRDRGAALMVHGSEQLRTELGQIDSAAVRFRGSTLEDVFLNLTGRELRDD